MTLKEILNYALVKSEDFTLHVYHLLIALMIFISTILILALLRRVFKGFVKRGTMDVGSSHSIFLIIKYFLWIISLAFILETLGVNVTILVASSAALLVGIGLGLQQIFNDVASGIMLLFERSLKVNDIVELENGIIGKVIKIGLRASKIVTRDNIIMIVPNSKFINDSVINWSHAEDKTRFHVNVGVDYGSDVELVKTVLLDCAKNHPEICIKNKPFVRFIDFADSSLNFQLYFWSKEAFMVENIKSDLRFSINKAFRENNITIPFPQRDIHMKS